MKKILLLPFLVVIANCVYSKEVELSGVYKQVYETMSQELGGASEQGSTAAATLAELQKIEKVAEKFVAAGSQKMTMAELDELPKKFKPKSREFWQELLCFDGMTTEDLSILKDSIVACKEMVDVNREMHHIESQLPEDTGITDEERKAQLNEMLEQRDALLPRCQLPILLSIAACTDKLVEPMKQFSTVCKEKFGLGLFPIMMANAAGENWLDEAALAKAEFLTKGVLASMLLAEVAQRAFSGYMDQTTIDEYEIVIALIDARIEQLRHAGI